MFKKILAVIAMIAIMAIELMGEKVTETIFSALYLTALITATATGAFFILAAKPILTYVPHLIFLVSTIIFILMDTARRSFQIKII
ncbi:hypothetical protein BMS3Abin15_00103 [bacterium BMS3Abin15]|nr:hypothetical protein BMS3Abin15_00103 [bacterium BMS3Abin15]